MSISSCGLHACQCILIGNKASDTIITEFFSWSKLVLRIQILILHQIELFLQAASPALCWRQCCGADPHHFYTDPDPAFHFDADPNTAPTFHSDADPNTDPNRKQGL
jgi:hypothetical protein